MIPISPQARESNLRNLNQALVSATAALASLASVVGGCNQELVKLHNAVKSLNAAADTIESLRLVNGLTVTAKEFWQGKYPPTSIEIPTKTKYEYIPSTCPGHIMSPHDTCMRCGITSQELLE